MDEIDKKILNILQRGDLCSPKVTQIAEELNLPPATVHVRLKKMKANGIIEKYTVIPDYKKVGKNATIFLVLKVDYKAHYAGAKPIHDFAKRLADIPEVQEIHMCSGDWDYLLKLKVRDNDDYTKILSEKILPLGGIEKAESTVTYRTFKETNSVPL